MAVMRLFGCTIHFRKSNAIVYCRFNLLRRKILKCDIDKSKIGWYPRRHSREICRQQNILKRTMKSNEGALRPRMAAALLLVLFMEIWGWDHNPKQLNSQQRGSHRRLGKAHGAREAPEAVSFRRARNATWAVLAGCIMPPNLLGHTMSGLHVRQAAAAGVASSQDPFHEL